MGRPSLLGDSQNDVDSLILADFAEEGEEHLIPGLQHSASLAIAMSSLTLILSDVLQTLYTVAAKREWLVKSSEQLMQTFFHFEHALQ